MKYIQPSLITSLVLAVGYLFFFNHEKLAYVESNKVLINYKAMQEASASYQKKLSIWTANIDTLRNELQQTIKKYEEQKPDLSKSQMAKEEKLIRTKQQQLIEYQRGIEEKAQKEDQEMTQRVLQRVNAFIKRYGETNGYDVIFAATESGNLVYAKDYLNITEEVLNGLNREYNASN